MALEVGIVGLPNAGKSTLFNALLGRQVAKAENYPFCTIDPNTGVVEVPDERLKKIASIVEPKKVIPSAFEFVDIAGLVEDAHQGAGLGNKFLSHIREVDAILYLLRDFESPDVAEAGAVSPKEDLETLKTELVLKDLETLNKIKDQKANTDEEKLRKKTAEKMIPALEKGALAKDVDLTEEEQEASQDFFLLTNKPIMIVINVSEEADYDQKRKEYKELDPIITSAKFEADLQQLSKEERNAFLDDQEYQSTLDKIITKAYNLLNLITFYTIKGGKETRAWPIEQGADVIQAAGTVHTDFAQNFVKAEVVSYQDFVDHQGWKGAQEAGKLRLEGKDYIVKDGDIIEIKAGSG
jgi:hypothetical protein